MTWLQSDGWDEIPPGQRFAELVERPGIVQLPGAHNALAGLIAKRVGFEGLYISGAAVSASLGLPDLGVMTLEELCFHARTVYRATQLPLVVDADTGYGEAVNVMRTVRELEAAGAAALQIEDQILPKKCGHLNDKRLVSVDDMCAKVTAAHRARTDIRIIARTDAVDTEGLDAAIGRMNCYIEAGADIVFADALIDEGMFRAVTQRVNAPFMANMTEFGRTPYYTAAQLEGFGCKLVIWPASSLRVAAKAMEKLYADLAAQGATHHLLDSMQTRSELYETIGYFEYEALDNTIAPSSIPEELPIPAVTPSTDD